MTGTGIRFPATLLPPDRDGYGDTFEETRSKFQPEVGSSKIRRRMRVPPRWFNLVWTLSDEQYSIFDQWWQNDIAGGGKLFDIQLSDDYDALTWYTVYGPIPYEAQRLEESACWIVRWRVRALGDTFGTDRPPGTNDLESLTSVGIQSAKAAVKSYTPINLRTSVGIGNAFVKLSLPPLLSRTSVGLYQLPTIVLQSLFTTTSRQWLGFGWFEDLSSQDIRTSLGDENREWMEF